MVRTASSASSSRRRVGPIDFVSRAGRTPHALGVDVGQTPRRGRLREAGLERELPLGARHELERDQRRWNPPAAPTTPDGEFERLLGEVEASTLRAAELQRQVELDGRQRSPRRMALEQRAAASRESSPEHGSGGLADQHPPGCSARRAAGVMTIHEVPTSGLHVLGPAHEREERGSRPPSALRIFKPRFVVNEERHGRDALEVRRPRRSSNVLFSRHRGGDDFVLVGHPPPSSGLTRGFTRRARRSCRCADDGAPAAA